MSASGNGAADRFLALWRETVDLGTAMAVLQWDLETQMPAKGVAGRSNVLSTLAGLRHGKLTSSELRDALEAAGDVQDGDDVLAAQVREARRAVDRQARVPEELARALSEAESRGHVAWKRAREESDFALFQPNLEELLSLKRQEADAAGAGQKRPFDVLLDDFEPGSTEEQLVPLFEELRAALSTLVRTVADSGVVVDEAPVTGAFASAAQLAFARDIAVNMGFDFDAGRIDLAPHPFCTGFHPDDVRITWRFLEHDLRSALFGIMHEAGHGLYEQGLPRSWAGTPIGGAVSLGVHESQSRLWENLVGRSKSFWRFALPRYHDAFPGRSDVTVDAIWPALHTVKPSLIRVEADEATYNLHIVVRFEVERRMIAGEVEVADVPELWDSMYEECLGVRAPDAANGCLQDIHWSMAGFGYFPTYTLGNLMASQLFSTARTDLGDLDAMFERGEFTPLREWLREKVHRHGSFHSANELIENATGRSLGTADFLDYVRSTTEAVYGVAVET